MKKIIVSMISTLGIVFLGYMLIQTQQDKIANSPEGLKQSFFAEYEEVVSHEKNAFSDSFYSVVMKQEFFEKDVNEQADFLFKLYDSFVENVVSEKEKEEFDYIEHLDLSIYSEFDQQGEKTDLFYGESNVYLVNKQYIHFNKLSGVIERNLLIPHFVVDNKEFIPTTNQLLFGLDFGSGKVKTLEEMNDSSNEISESNKSLTKQEIEDSWTTSSGEDMTQMDAEDIEKELNKRYKNNYKSEDYNSKGEYKPANSMTQDEIEAELEEIISNNLGSK